MPKSPLRIMLVALAGALPIAVACGDDATSTPAAAPAATEAPTATPGSSSGGPAAPDPDASAPTDGGRDAKAPPAIAAFDKAIAAAVCERLTSCCAKTDYDTYFAQFQGKPYELASAPPAAQCATVLAETLGRLHEQKWGPSIALGRMAFDDARGAKCVADVKAAACGVPLTETLYEPECFGIRGNEVFKKTNPVGAACDDIGDTTFNGECNPALGYCGSSKKCEAWKLPGEDCSVIPTRQFCRADLACDGLAPNAPGKCTAAPIMKNMGEECLAVTGPFLRCPANAYCDFDTKVCTPKKADGQACGGDDQCATFHPFSCSPLPGGTCGTTSFCSTPDGGAR
jgi:hypothetical protein